MDIMMDARGATPEEKQRGIAAAWAVIERFGLTAEEAAEGSFAVEVGTTWAFRRTRSHRKTSMLPRMFGGRPAMPQQGVV
ncbi:hypothetical protein [Mesorhizobium sp. WSM3859]|uniref:hypothetical protein n=1 Tax=Mesorhizobium sp. WSM3859 TaxID=2029402 RepID=UPI000BB0BF79|nr:hypothetical protein [Mesorhizobium sp. WSM3859]PBC09452.1 hypothetical protein CK230_15075 [Mesorhizobium sp. WSM3859]